MRIPGAFVFALLVGSAAHAQEPAQPAGVSIGGPETSEFAVPASEAPEVPRVEPRTVESERRPAPEVVTEVQDPFQRGSFWWYVGVIVVAGVILAFVL